MKIKYNNRKVQALFENFSLMEKKNGFKLTHAIKKRYKQLSAAETFYDYLLTGLGKPHPLSGPKKKHYGISITKNIRLVVEPIADDLSEESLKKCKELIIISVEDYHGSKTTTYIP